MFVKLRNHGTFLFLICIFFTQNLFSQHYSIYGYIFDGVKKEALISATVQVHSGSRLIGGVITDTKGKFVIYDIPKGNYSLLVSYVGYKSYKTNFEITDKSIDFKNISLSSSVVKLNEVTVEGKAQPVVQIKDTTEFNAIAYKVNKDANADELITKLPGVTIDDGKVTAHGEEVKTVLVDGKQFFGSDPNAVLKNVPAEIIDKIQLYDKQSDQSEFTGFDDGNSAKTINIITKVRYRNGIFGRASGGYGTEEKYAGSGSINYFKNEERLSAVAQLNNINEQNFSIDDMMGIMSGAGRRGGFSRPGGGGGATGSPRVGGAGGGREVSNFMVNAKDGLTETKALGLNLSDMWFNKIDFTGSYFFNKTSNDARTDLNRVYYPVSGLDQAYKEQNSSNSNNINHRMNFRINYQLDSMNSVLLTPQFSFQGNDGESIMNGRTFSSIKDINSTNNLSNSNLDAYDASTEILFRHKFAEKGRTISARMRLERNSNTGDNKLYSDNIYYNNLFQSDTIDQNADLNKHEDDISGNLVYTEPVGNFGQLQLTTNFSHSNSKSDMKTYDLTAIILNNNHLDTALSSLYEKNYNTHGFGLGYGYRNEDIMFTGGVNYSLATLGNDQVFPYSASMTKNFTSFLPYLMLRYGQRRVQEIMVDYRVTNNEPSVTQLQNVLDNSNPLQLSIGNPNLKQDTRHAVSIRFSKTNTDNYSAFFLLFSGTLTQNYIGYQKIIALRDTTVSGIKLNTGTQLQTPINLDGYKNFRSMATYSTPIEFLSSNVNLNLSYTFSKTPVIQNLVSGFTNSSSYALGFVLSSNISEDIDFSISNTNTYNNIKTDFRTSGNQNYFGQRTKLKIYYDIYEGIIIQSDLDYKYDGGLSSGSNPNSYSWNASLRKKLFKNDRGEIKLTVYDILKMNSNNNRNVTDTYYEDTNTNVLGRFYILSFNYSIRAFGV
jgi:hypothetical protein